MLNGQPAGITQQRRPRRTMQNVGRRFLGGTLLVGHTLKGGGGLRCLNSRRQGQKGLARRLKLRTTERHAELPLDLRWQPLAKHH